MDAGTDAADVDSGTSPYVFFDDFSAGSSKWTTLSGTWIVASGAFEQTGLGYDTKAVAGSTWSDLTVEASVVLHSGNDDLERVLVRVVDANNFVGGYITKFYGAVGIEQIIGGTRTFTQAAFVPVVGQTYILKLVVSGSSAMIYVNGTLAHSRTLPGGGPTSGKIGLSTSAADVSFDDVKVTTP
jgi:hypothetical protein